MHVYMYMYMCMCMCMFLCLKQLREAKKKQETKGKVTSIYIFTAHDSTAGSDGTGEERKDTHFTITEYILIISGPQLCK